MKIRKIFFLVMILSFLILGHNPAGAQISTYKKPVKFAFTGVIIQEDLDLNSSFIKYLSQKLNRPIELIYRKSYVEIDELLEKREVDLAWICGSNYVRDHQNFGLELLVIPQVKGYQDGKYQSYIIVLEESNLHTFKELRGRTYAFADPLSNSGKIIPTYMLAKMEETPDSFFKKFIFTYSHYESIQAVAEGFVDGASVDSFIFDSMEKINPYLINKIRIIHRSDWYGFTPLVIRKGMGKSIREKLQKILLEMKSNPEGKEILEKYGLENFIMKPDSHYDSIRKMINYLAEFDDEKGEK